MMFVVKIRGLFNINKDCHEVETRQLMNIHIYQVNIAKYGNGVYHMAARIYNRLPKELKLIPSNINKFKVNLKKFLYRNSYYTLDEFLNR
jgi:hypothetical protein